MWWAVHFYGKLVWREALTVNTETTQDVFVITWQAGWDVGRVLPPNATLVVPYIAWRKKKEKKA